MKLKRQFYIGLDLGKKQDYTAIAVMEQCVWTTGRKDPVTFAPVLERHTVLRHLERLPQGTAYLRVVKRVREILMHEKLRDEGVVLAMDATGVGEPVFELIERMVRQVQGKRRGWLNWAGVVFTAGGKTTWKQYQAYVPKNTLMEGLVLGFERRDFVLDEGMRWVKELARELQMMTQARGENGMRWVSEGEHDDLAMAFALAVWGTTYWELGRNWVDLRWGRPSWEIEAMQREREGLGER